jgi:MFS family permease
MGVAWKQRGLVSLLLLLGVGLRLHELQAQPAFIDEGYHAHHARLFWTFEDHPAQYADGKLLLFVWLSPFVVGAPSDLFAVRASMVLLSALSLALVWTVARRWVGALGAGVAALAYALLPYSFFYERMAMSDPLANTLMLAFSWRVLVLAKRATLREAFVVGVLLGAVSLAKLLTASLALLVPLGILLWRGQYPLKAYLVPLAVVAGVVVLMWLPMLVPIALSQTSDRPMSLVDPIVIDDGTSRGAYLAQTLPALADFVPLPLLLVALLGAWRADKRPLLFVIGLAALVVSLPLALASIATARYFMPLGSVLCLLLGLVVGRWGGRVALAVVLLSLAYSVPFVASMWQSPPTPAFGFRNTSEYLSGALNTERSAIASARLLNDLPADTPTFGTWYICAMMVFEVRAPMNCFDRPLSRAEFARLFTPRVAQGQTAYVVVSHYATRDAIQFFAPSSYVWEFVAEFPRQADPSYYVYIWRVTRYDE